MDVYVKAGLVFQGSAGPSDTAPLTGAVRKTCSSAVRLHLRRQHRCVCVCVCERERERVWTEQDLHYKPSFSLMSTGGAVYS